MAPKKFKYLSNNDKCKLSNEAKQKEFWDFSLVLNFNIKENHSFLEGLSWRPRQKKYLGLDVPQVQSIGTVLMVLCVKF